MDSSSSCSQTTTLPILFNPQSLLSNITLNNEYYLTWSSQFLSVLRTHNLENVVTDKVCPPTENSDKTPNPKHLQWQKATSIILAWIRATVSQPILASLVSYKTAPEAWDILKTRFSSSSKTHIRNLKKQLTTLKKNPMTLMSDYLDHAKNVANSLQCAGNKIDDNDLIDHILDGLGPEYEAVVRFMAYKPPENFEDFQEHLAEQENINKRLSNLIINSGTALVVNTTNKNSFNHNTDVNKGGNDNRSYDHKGGNRQ